MTAFRLLDWMRPPELVPTSVPEPGPGEVRVRVAGCGLCHSDLTITTIPPEVGAGLGWKVPFTLGHETAGWVDAWGAGVEGLVEGEPVVIASPSSCGHCARCRRGLESACRLGGSGRGYGLDGGLAEFVLVTDPGRSLLSLPTVLDPRRAGPLSDAAATAHHAVARAIRRVRSDGATVVIGVGGLGSFGVQLARALTAGPVVAVDPSLQRRSVAVSLGAHVAVDGVGAETAEALRGELGGVQVDAVVDFVGTDETISFALEVVEPGGSVAVVGAGGGRVRQPVLGGIPADVEVWSFQGSDLADLRAVLELAARGEVRIDVDGYPLSRVAEAYEALASARLRGRAVITPDALRGD